MRKKRIKFLPGLMPYDSYMIEFIAYIVMSSLFLMPEIQDIIWVPIILILIVFLWFRIKYFKSVNGYVFFIKVKNNNIYIARDWFLHKHIYKRYMFREDLMFCKTKVAFHYKDRAIGQVPQEVIVDVNGKENAFIIIHNENFVDENLVKKLHRNIETMDMKEKVKYSGNLMKNKNIILLSGSKSNYNFLRQYITKEQFCGLTENDNKDLEKYEEIYQRKLSKNKK